MNRTIDLNADVGEGGGYDDLLIPLVSSVNIACGGHAGDEETMRGTISAALRAGAAIGAHPGYEDRANFGRTALAMDPDTLRQSILHQLRTFHHIALECGASVHHVKPHGALYNQANKDAGLAACFVECVNHALPGCRVYCPPQGELARAAAAAGLDVVAEGFADRAYADDGSLVPRDQPGAILCDPESAAAQALQIATHAQVSSLSGKTIPLPARTLCIHGDSPNAVAMLKSIRTALVNAGIRIQKP